MKLADGKERTIQHMMMTSFWHPDGTPMSAQQFMELLFGKLPEFFHDEAELRAHLERARHASQAAGRAGGERFGQRAIGRDAARSSTPRKATCSTCWPTSPMPFRR